MEYKVGDKVWARYGVSWSKAKIIGVKNEKEYLVKIPFLGIYTLGTDNLLSR